MIDYLIAREEDENLRTSVRELVFPDGTVRSVETYRLVWRWYDRLVEAAGLTTDAGFIAQVTVSWADEHDCSIEDAFAASINHIVEEAERQGMDVTDDTLILDTGRKRVATFKERQNKRRSA